MADEKVEAPAAADNKQQTETADKPAEQKKSGSMLPWIITGVVVLVMAGAGLGLGLLFAGNKQPPSESSKPPATETDETKTSQPAAPAAAANSAWYTDLDPVVANLNEPGATRYVRAVLTLEISGELPQDKGTVLLEQKKPLLTNLLTIYLAGLNVEATRGDKNLKRIQSEICDAFNERLFPDSKPMIKGILIKEFAVQ